MNISDSSDGNIFCGLEPHDYLEVKFFLTSVIGSLVGLFGIFGNVSTVLILTRPSMRNPNNLFLTALAIFDSCLLVTAFFIYGMEYIIEYTQTFDLYVAWLTYLRFAFALSHISQTGSVYTTVSVTVERYLAVCYPKSSKKYCTSRGSALSVLCVTCFSVIFNSTKFFELEISRNPVCGDGTDWQSFLLLPSRLAQNPLYGQIYALWLTNLVMVFFPFLTLLVLNSIIACTIRKSLQKVKYSQRFHSRSVLKEKSREATLVLVVIVCIFLLCNVWGFVLTLLEQILDRRWLEVEHHAFYTFSREAINLLAIINSSINFAIYIIFGKDFRKELVVIYGCGVRGMTLRLPTHDKFNIWRNIARRRPTLLSVRKANVLRSGFHAIRSSSFGTEHGSSAMTLNAITPISDIAEAEVQKSMSSSFNWANETNANVNQTNNVSSLKKLSNIPLNPSLNPPLNPPLCNEIHHKKRLSLPIPMYYEKYHCTPTKQQFNESAQCECSLVECFCDKANWRKRSTVSMDTAETSKRWCSLRKPSHTLMNPLTLSAMIEQNTMDDEEDDDEIIILDALDGSAFKQKFKCWLEESKQSHHGVNVDTIEHSESFTTAYENFI